MENVIEERNYPLHNNEMNRVSRSHTWTEYICLWNSWSWWPYATWWWGQIGNLYGWYFGIGKIVLFYWVVLIIDRYVANKICRFLKWKGYDAHVFSCSEIRKKRYPEFSTLSSEYWNLDNKEVWVSLVFKGVDDRITIDCIKRNHERNVSLLTWWWSSGYSRWI